MFRLPLTTPEGVVAGQPEIDTGKRLVLTNLAVWATFGGLLGGIFLAMQLDDKRVVQDGLWTALLSVAALSALPLVATTTQVIRMWARRTWSGWNASALVVIPMLAAAGVTLLSAVLCLYEIAVTSGSSNPNDLVIWLTVPIVFASAGAAVFGVAAAILDAKQ